MNIIEFRKEIINILKNIYNFSIVKECEVLKNNGIKLIGICLGEEQTKVCLSVYLEEYYDSYNNGKTLQEIAEEITRVNEARRFKGEFNSDNFLNYESIKDKLYIKLINTEDNLELLESVPNKAFLDLSLIVYCDVSELCGLSACVNVKKEHVEAWGVTSEELIETACNNTRSKTIKIRNIANVLDKFITDEIKDSDSFMYVMMSDELMFSACGMIFDDILDEFVCEKHKGVYIIPSSIYEVILLPDNDRYNKDEINQMIKEVNGDVLDKMEVLSSHGYYYSSENGYSIV